MVHFLIILVLISQDYSNFISRVSCEGSDGSTIRATDSEIKTISETLYSLDTNRASTSDIRIDPQALIPHSETGSMNDLAKRPLFQYVNEGFLFSKPTYSALIALLDNYIRNTGVVENNVSQEVQEQEKFLKEAMQNTALGRELYHFFNNKGFYRSWDDFLYDLKMMWFGLYSRKNGVLDSSGFEHIFLGEIKGSKVSGFHNWVTFYLQEKKGLLNYYSHSFDGPWSNYPDVLGMQFMWDGFYKQVGSSIIGSSPEYDLAIYTLCYVTRPGKLCKVSMDGKQLSIQTYTWDNSSYGEGKKYIASAYPATP